MTLKNPHAYTIGTVNPKRNYPIRFNEDTPLYAPVGVVIVTDGLEHMRIPNGWINAFGDKLTNDEMKDLLIKDPTYSYVVRNPHRDIASSK